MDDSLFVQVRECVTDAATQFQPIGNRLEDAIRTDAVGAVAVLDAPEAFPFQESGDCEEGREGDDYRGGGEEC